MDVRIKEAIREAVQEAGQSSQLANKLVVWVDAAISGNESLSDSQAVDMRLEVVYEATEVGEGEL